MSLIRRNSVPLFIVLAVIAVGVGAVLFRSPFAFGEEPTGCNASVVGMSILVTDGDGTVHVTTDGASLNYQVILSIPEQPAGDVACNYGGGSLSITLPSGETVSVAEDIPTISAGNPFSAAAVSYAVNQADAVNMELTAKADYSGGMSFSVPEGEDPPPATASVSNTIRMSPPSIGLTMTPDTQTVFQGQSASFEITVTNTGGFELSNVAIADDMAPECAADLGTLGVDESVSHSCSVVPTETFINEATVTAEAIGGVAEGEGQVSDFAAVEVIFSTVEIAVSITAESTIARIGEDAVFNIQVSNLSDTPLDDVAVSVASDNAGTVADLDDCALGLGTVEAASQSDVYSCSVALPPGTNMITATAMGTVPGTTSVVEASDTDEVEVISPGLFIKIVPGEQTIREGESALLTIELSNNGDTTLTNVTVSVVDGNGNAAESCANSFEELSPSGDSIRYDCTTGGIAEDSTFIATVQGNVVDGGTESSSSAPATVVILRPSTAVNLGSIEVRSEFTESYIRLVVHHVMVTETNDGDSPLTDIYVELSPTGAILTNESPEFVGGDLPNENGDLGIMEPGETWEWRVISVAIIGDFVTLPTTTESIQYEAIGHGIDLLGGDVTFPGDAEERGILDIPIVTTP